MIIFPSSTNKCIKYLNVGFYVKYDTLINMKNIIFCFNDFNIYCKSKDISIHDYYTGDSILVHNLITDCTFVFKDFNNIYIDFRNDVILDGDEL